MIAALANADGVVVIIGLHEKAVEGVQRAREADRSAWRQAAVDHLIPVPRTVVHTVRCTRTDGTPDERMVIEVPPSERVHATTRDEGWLRVGDDCRRLEFQERLELRRAARSGGAARSSRSRSFRRTHGSLMRRDGPVGTGDLLRASGQSRPTALRHLEALAEGGWITRSGGGATDPGAVWPTQGERR